MTTSHDRVSDAPSLHLVARATSRWRAHAMDGALLAAFMVVACAVVALVQHPASPARAAIGSDVARRAIIGLAMGLTAVALIYSPWGRRSGALMNPAVAVCHWRAGRISARDALHYSVAQCAGAVAGVSGAALLLGSWISHPDVNYVATVPGQWGAAAAWASEFAIAFFMMFVVTGANRVERLRPYTGWFAGALVAVYITFEAPLSGMSLNPARTFGSSAVGGVWTGWWVYLTAPLLGMLCGIEVWRARARSNGGRAPCGKFCHDRRSAIPCDCGDPIPRGMHT